VRGGRRVDDFSDRQDLEQGGEGAFDELPLMSYV
jgi:hypothetical protein